MNKRQKLKKRKGKQKKGKQIVYVDGKNITDGSTVDVFISNKFEVLNVEGEIDYFTSTIQNRHLSQKKWERKGWNEKAVDYLIRLEIGRASCRERV